MRLSDRPNNALQDFTLRDPTRNKLRATSDTPPFRRYTTLLLGCALVLALMFGIGYLAGNAERPHATIGGSTVPSVHCAEDTVITFTGDGDTLGCVHIETVAQREIDRVQGLQDAGYDLEVYETPSPTATPILSLGTSPDDCVYGEAWRNDACFPLTLEELQGGTR